MAPGDTDPSELEALLRHNDALLRENAELRRAVALIPKLIARIEELEQKLAIALRAQRRQAAPFSKGPPKEHPQTRGRKPGPDYGKIAYRPIPERIDKIPPAALPDSCVRGGRVQYDHTIAQFQVEIPKKPIHRRFDIEVGYCQYCGKRI